MLVRVIFCIIMMSFLASCGSTGLVSSKPTIEEEGLLANTKKFFIKEPSKIVRGANIPENWQVVYLRPTDEIKTELFDRVEVTTDDILEKGYDYLINLFGTPYFIKKDKDIEIWQYWGNSCIVDVFIYEEEKNKRINFIDIREISSAQPVSKTCLSDIATINIEEIAKSGVKEIN